MGQAEIVNYLKAQKEPKSRSEIAEALKQQPTKISASLKKMIRLKEIKFKEIDRIKALELYNCKRRMRVYYI